MRRAALLALAALVLAGCAALPEAPTGPPSTQIVAPADGALARQVAAAGVPEGQTGFKPLLYAVQALQVRLALIARAEQAIDIQTYVLGDDATGHQMLRALREAAARGVRVRLLVDDMHTVGTTEMLLAMAAQPNVELRLYNPFSGGRDSWALRALALLGDFERLNRRMHNKLFVVDGRMAIVGGRNLADAYFMRSDEGNFIDFDLLCAGAVAAELGGHFDEYWNSRFAVPVQALGGQALDEAARRSSFDALTRNVTPPHAVAAMPPGLVPGLGALVVAPVQVFFDSPRKTAGEIGQPMLLPVAGMLQQARRSVVVVSPYFVPSAVGIERMRRARERGVQVQVITNSLVDSDEPLVNVAYGRRRVTLLRAGIRLFELSSAQLHRQPLVGQALGSSVGRLHAKLGFIDERWLLVGSMNLDPRSANSNTELALAVDSEALTREVISLLEPAEGGSTYEVRLADDGERLEWVAQGAGGSERLDDEPQPPWYQRLKLWLLSLIVPDDLL